MYNKIIIDASHLFYRNFYTLQRFRYNGVPTGMQYGVLNSMLKFKREYKGQLIVALDMGNSGRKEVSAEYKAGRISMGSDFYTSFESTKNLLYNAGITLAHSPDSEADDVIATLAEGSCLIVTGDHDMQQLITDTIHVLKPLKKDYQLITKDVFISERGYEPNDLVFIQAMVGDKCDNIEGVYGIGPKKALDLLNQYGDELRDFISCNAFSEKYGEMKEIPEPILQENKKLLFKSYILTQLMIQDSVITSKREADPVIMEELFKSLGFNSFLKQDKFAAVMELGAI